MLALVLSMFGALVVRLGQVQVSQAPVLSTQARTVDSRVVVTPALRGDILDRSGAVLATNTFTTTVTLERSVLVDSEDGGRALVERVATALGRPAQPLWDRTTLCGTTGAAPAPACFNGSPHAPIPLATDVPAQAALSLLERPEAFPGIAVQADPARRYPGTAGANLAHVLGHIARSSAQEVEAGTASEEELLGRDGLEQQYDTALRGRAGTRTVRVDARGIVTGTLLTTPAVPGSDLLTNIDAGLQARTEAILRETLAAARASGQAADAAGAVVMDVRTGAVRAAASLPTYDPNVFVGGISASEYTRLSTAASNVALRSRVTSQTFPPASTFKVISVPAAVAAGNDLQGRYDCSPSYTVGGRVFNNYESRGYGSIDLHKALVVSCDTVFYRFAHAVWQSVTGPADVADGADPFIRVARDFGIGQRTGVDLPGESAGVLPSRQWKLATWQATREQTCARAASGYPDLARTDPERAAYLTQLAREGCDSGYEYRPGDAVNFSIGQGDLKATVLQMAVVYAAVANGGTVVTPRVAAGLRDHAGTVTPVPAGRTRALTVPGPVLEYMRAALADVTQPGGSAGSAFSGQPAGAAAAAGKTGTGEVFGQQATAWFAGYEPVGQPRHVVVVVVSQGGSGSGVAAPAVARIFEAVRAARLP